MTGIIRFSWLTEQGAPSSSGTAEPEWDGFKVFCIEIFLPDRFLWRIYLKILPEIYQNNQRFSVILELHFQKNVIQCGLPRKNYLEVPYYVRY